MIRNSWSIWVFGDSRFLVSQGHPQPPPLTAWSSSWLPIPHRLRLFWPGHLVPKKNMEVGSIGYKNQNNISSIVPPASMYVLQYHTCSMLCYIQHLCIIYIYYIYIYVVTYICTRAHEWRKVVYLMHEHTWNILELVSISVSEPSYLTHPSSLLRNVGHSNM